MSLEDDTGQTNTSGGLHELFTKFELFDEEQCRRSQTGKSLPSHSRKVHLLADVLLFFGPIAGSRQAGREFWETDCQHDIEDSHASVTPNRSAATIPTTITTSLSSHPPVCAKKLLKDRRWHLMALPTAEDCGPTAGPDEATVETTAPTHSSPLLLEDHALISTHNNR